MGTATATDVLAGKTFTNTSGIGLTGTMVNQGAWTSTPTAKGKMAIPAGYHNGSGYIDTTGVYNKGYTDGLASAQNANVQYNCHYHEDSCYTLYANGNCNSCAKAGGSCPANNIPIRCGYCGASYSWVTFSTTNVLTCGYNEGQILSATIKFN